MHSHISTQAQAQAIGVSLFKALSAVISVNGAIGSHFLRRSALGVVHTGGVLPETGNFIYYFGCPFAQSRIFSRVKPRTFENGSQNGCF